jgi:hypothetical protein
MTSQSPIPEERRIGLGLSKMGWYKKRGGRWKRNYRWPWILDADYE